MPTEGVTGGGGLGGGGDGAGQDTGSAFQTSTRFRSAAKPSDVGRGKSGSLANQKGAIKNATGGDPSSTSHHRSARILVLAFQSGGRSKC